MPNVSVFKVALIAVVVFIFIGGCGTAIDLKTSQDVGEGSQAPDRETPEPKISVRPPPVSVSEFHHFDSFPDIVATSDAVIIAEVTANLGGYLVGQYNEKQILTYEIAVEEVLAGEIDAKSFVLEIDNVVLAYMGDDTWTEPGERSIMFLLSNEFTPIEGPSYRLINSQGVFRIDGENRLDGPRDDNEFVQQVSTWTLPELLAQTTSANALIESGQVQGQPHQKHYPTPPDGEASLITKPQPPPGFEPRN